MTRLDPRSAFPVYLAAGALIVGALANIAYAAVPGRTKVTIWLVTLAMVTVLCACIGKGIANRWDGVLVDGRNRVSLSRLQMVAWSLLVLSGLATAAATNLAIAGNTAALDIVIQDELLAVMGIAATSLAATPALLKLKEGNAAGAVATRNDPAEASWLDLFRGDEADDEAKPDLSKIQQFLISLVLIGAYSVALGNLFRALGQGEVFKTFPPLDPKFVWLLGISHAGYLTYKAAPKPPTPVPPTPAPPVPAPAPAPEPAPTPDAASDGRPAVTRRPQTPAQAREIAQRYSLKQPPDDGSGAPRA